MAMSREELLAAIKDSPLSEEDCAALMTGITYKLMANVFVSGGLDMMSDPGVWGGADAPQCVDENGAGGVCGRDRGHRPPHRDSDGSEW
jgi:hypothetical protein